MLVPLSWLRDFAPFDLDPVELGRVFDDLGMVVEGITYVGGGLDGVVVARVAEIQPIPGADKIRKVLVDAGGPALEQIVCGAWNFSEGDLVPLARVGSVLPGDFAIGRRKMKGVVSDGMLCSAPELALGEDAGGLLVLPPGLPPGQPIAAALGITPDVVYDLAIEANRPDANCVVGVARDAAARLGLPFWIPPSPPLPLGQQTAFEVDVSSPELCDRFNATVFTGLTVAPSPAWVTRRLILAGMRPISNIVDASNYVMLELGQPTHAYDLDRLPSPALGARAARRGERVTTLDGVERELGVGATPDCVICDGNDEAIGIAGVMGGASSEVHDGTTRVVLEAAHFVPMAIARTSKRLGLRSEASARFERGVDVEGIDRSVGRFAAILAETCPSLGASGPVDWRAPLLQAPPAISVRPTRVNAVLGTSIDPAEMTRLLTPIGFAVSDGGPHLSVRPPTFRPDVTSEIDVIEEIARHHGYINIPRATVRPPQVGALTAYQKDRRLTREVMAGAGLSEAAGSPLIGPGDHARAGLPEDGISAVDPLAREESVLRTSLLPGLLKAVVFNADRRNPDLGLFEVGRVWRPGHPSGQAAPGPDSSPGHGLPDEREMLGVVLAGAGPFGTGSDAPAAVRVLRRLAAALRVAGLELEAGEAPGLHPTRSAEILLDGRGAGWVGEVDPDVLSAWGIDGRVGWIEVELPVLAGARRMPQAATPVSRFPSSDIDLAFVVDESAPASAVEAALRSAGGDLLERVTLFDVYRGAGIARGARSLAYRLRFVAPDRTLTDAEVGDLRARCIDAVESALPATLR